MNIRVASYKHLKDKSKICSLLGFCIVRVVLAWAYKDQNYCGC